jgi:hypothetical protein
MRKTHAIEIFGSVRALADALGIQPQAIYQWPDDLDQKRVDWIKGAALRLHKPGVEAVAEVRP